jgi:4-hydroxybenzoate polyprenyltransferase
VQIVAGEAAVTWHLLRHNLSFGFLPPFFMAAGSILASGAALSWINVVAVTVRLGLLCFGFLYAFDVANQVMSIDEDRLNKPTRPIACGRVSPRGAALRWGASWVLLPLYAWAAAGTWPGLASALLWEAIIALFYVWPRWGDGVLGRAAFTPLAVWVQLVLTTFFVAGKAPASPWFCLPRDLALVPLWVACTIHLQEFHDVAGDAKTGRTTLATLFAANGARELRIVTALSVILFSVGLAWISATRPCTPSMHGLLVGWAVAESALALVVAWRTVALSRAERRRVDVPLFLRGALRSRDVPGGCRRCSRRHAVAALARDRCLGKRL